MFLFDIQCIAVEIANYKLSYLELIGTTSGLLSVYLATKANFYTWYTGILNEIAFFMLFFQVQLYADMLLQVFFLIVTLYGIYNWKTKQEEAIIYRLSPQEGAKYALGLLFSTLLTALFIGNIHHILPFFFEKPSTYPLTDAFIMLASILATFLLAQKKLETWLLWIIVDIVSIFLYALKGIYFVAGEYVIFLFLAIWGFWEWREKYLEME